MTLRELNASWRVFLDARIEEIEALGSMHVIDWPLGYLILAIVGGFIGIAVVLGVVVGILSSALYAPHRDKINEDYEASIRERGEAKARRKGPPSA